MTTIRTLDHALEFHHAPRLSRGQVVEFSSEAGACTEHEMNALRRGIVFRPGGVEIGQIVRVVGVPLTLERLLTMGRFHRTHIQQIIPSVVEPGDRERVRHPVGY